MVMFTEAEVQRLMTLSKVSRPSHPYVDFGQFTMLWQCELELEDLKARYSCYLAAGHISVYNPVSIMSALEQVTIENFWVATGLLAMIIFFVLQPTE